MEALEALDARSGEVRAPVRLRTESDVCAATEAASPRAPRNPRPALSLLAAPPTRPPQLQSRAEVDYKVWVERVVAEAVLPGGLGRASAALRRAPPLLGEHTRDVLAEILGLGDDEIASLYEDKVVA